MSIAQKLLPEFEQEMKATRRLLERVPSDKAEWKPHPKSFSLGHLAQLVSWMPGWITNALTQTDLDLGKAGGYSIEKTETLLAGFDKNVEGAMAAIAASKDEDYNVMWSLKRNDQVFMTMPRDVVVRQHISHLVHHRAQLTVYLRLLDVPIPSIYGPTADEKWGPTA
ncbi:MAG TPA: DinB family protein [Longimicrobiales bacterium]|nr:DinB family protein [Longimicrobiales bacterium]